MCSNIVPCFSLFTNSYFLFNFKKKKTFYELVTCLKETEQSKTNLP